MKPFRNYIKLILVGIGMSPLLLSGQSLSVGTPGLEDTYRTAQLLGKVDSSWSFVARPFYPSIAGKFSNIFDPDSSLKNNRWNKWDGTFTFAKSNGFIQLLPVTLLERYIRPCPISMNDGLMIPAKGFQTLLSAGVYAKIGPLSIQFQPEYLYAENKAYNGFAQEHTDLSWSNYYQVYNYIDLPERFGNGPYQRATWGQSSIRLTFGPASIGVSNENLWWGPGMRNSLLMSNSAPGFKHITLNTVRPIKTPIGSFEGQLVAGRLDNSGFLPPSKNPNNPVAPWFAPRPDYWRYFNGIVLSYQPKWVPGLFLGATRAFQTYNINLGKELSSYLPVILPMRKKVITDMDEEILGRDQLASLFVRWLWLKQKAEFYAEYARGDHAADLRDLYLDPNHTAAYLFGIRKMVPLKKAADQFIQVNVEFTHLESVVSERSGNAPSPFYVHYQITQGYTNQGQMLGAGIGPGSNLQTLNVSWVHGLKVVGIQVERYLHNADLHYLTGLDFRNIWADIITSLVGSWDYKNLVVTLKMDAIISFNYQFRYNPTDGRSFWDHGKDVYSGQALLGVMYRF